MPILDFIAFFFPELVATIIYFIPALNDSIRSSVQHYLRVSSLDLSIVKVIRLICGFHFDLDLIVQANKL